MKMTFTDEQLSGGGNGTFLGVGEHQVVVQKAESATSKAGNQQAIITFSDGGTKDRKCYFSLADKAKWKIAAFAKACGHTDEYLKSGEFDFPSDVLEKRLTLTVEKVGVEVYEGKERGKYQESFSPAKSANFETDDIPF